MHATCFYLRVVCAVLKCFAFELAYAYHFLWNGTPYTTISIATLILQREILFLTGQSSRITNGKRDESLFQAAPYGTTWATFNRKLDIGGHSPPWALSIDRGLHDNEDQLRRTTWSETAMLLRTNRSILHHGGEGWRTTREGINGEKSRKNRIKGQLYGK